MLKCELLERARTWKSFEGWDLQMPISLKIMSLINLANEAFTLQILERSTNFEVTIKTSVICLSNAFDSKLEDKERLWWKWYDVKDVSSWKGPELKRVSKAKACKCHFPFNSNLPQWKLKTGRKCWHYISNWLEFPLLKDQTLEHLWIMLKVEERQLTVMLWALGKDQNLKELFRVRACKCLYK